MLSQKRRLDHLYRVRRKEYKTNGLTQKLPLYKNRAKQYRQNRLFQSNQSKFYQKCDGKSHKKNIIPDKEKATEWNLAGLEYGRKM